LAEWNSVNWIGSGVVPVILARFAINADGLLPTVMRGVPFSAGLRVPGSPPMPVMALASVSTNVVYGAVMINLGGSPPARQPYWIPVGALPRGESVSALEPYQNGSILIGTDSGKVYFLPILDVPTEIPFDSVPGSPYSSGVVTGPVRGIASNGKTILCIKGYGPSYLFVTQLDSSASTRVSIDGHPIHTFVPIDPSICPLNDGETHYLRGVCANRSVSGFRMGIDLPFLTFAATFNEDELWISDSPLALRWHRLAAGLPVAVRCADVVFSENGDLFLSTYGRGAWQLVG